MHACRSTLEDPTDIVGEDDVSADAEVLAVALDALRLLGLGADDIVARVNDRRLLEKLLLGAGVPADQLPATYAAIDKLGREDDARIRDRLAEHAGLGQESIDAIFAIFASRSFEELAAAHAGGALAEELDRMALYFEYLREMQLGDYVAFDPTIVRGLAYYTGIVFEIFDRKGELRAVCGGGRYDRLLAAVSDTDLPALGFGMGDVVLGELLRERGLLPPTKSTVDFYVIAVTDGERPVVRELAHRLREQGRTVLYGLRGVGVGKQFKDADARGAARAIVIGPDEAREGVGVVKEMKTGLEQRVPLSDIG